MKTYCVEVMVIEAMYSTIEVEAENEDQAQQMCEQMVPYSDFTPESENDYGEVKVYKVTHYDVTN